MFFLFRPLPDGSPFLYPGGLLHRLASQGLEVLPSEEEIDGTPAYKLKVTRANGDVDTVYLDEEYFVEFRSDAKREVQGSEIEVTTIIGDYKEVEGLVFAHSMEISFGGQGQQVITIETTELGLDIPDERFAMPEKAETEETAEE